MTRPIKAVLFDLDGTLLDTAPDMVGALNALRSEHHMAPLPYERVRGIVSHGAARLVETGFPNVMPERALELKQCFLQIYRGALSQHTKLFPGMEEVLNSLRRCELKIGVVTNKPAWLTDPLLEQLALRERFDCIVSGDSVAERKPHPLPLLHAAAIATVAPDECIYVGDAERDVQAAHAAGMTAVVANYGYLGVDEDSTAWGADVYIGNALDLLAWLKSSGRI